VKKTFLLTILLLFFFVNVSSCFAISRKAVLAAEIETANIPPTVEGPGFVMPDSPFYFLDQIKQSLRIMFALNQESRARIYANIAGERMAELRFMLQNQNENGAKLALNGVSESFKNAKEQLGAAKSLGKDISKLAKEINDSIREKQQVLDELRTKKEGELGMQVEATTESLTETKIRIGEYLNPSDLANEIKYDTNRELELKFQEASNSAQALKEALEDLKLQRQQAAEEQLRNREEALNRVIDEQGEAIRIQERVQLEAEQKAFEKTLLLEEEAIEEIQANVAKAQQAALKYQNLQKGNQ
jgi:hypothetical protein